MRLVVNCLIQVLVLAVISRPGATQELVRDDSVGWAEWEARCLSVPSNQQLLVNRARIGKAAMTSVEFDALLDQFLKQQLADALAQDALWVDGKPPASFYDAGVGYFEDKRIPFSPFAQKLMLAPGSKIVFQGDLHGDIRSLLTSVRSLQQRGILRGFEIVDSSAHLIFLGDYTDRGQYGLEVIATLLRLRLENPGRVWMARGNHEEFHMIGEYGFLRELRNKFGTKYHPRKVARTYDCLPAVIYLGTPAGDFIQCNHGGMEPGYSPTRILESSLPIAYQKIGSLRQASFVEKHPELLVGVSAPERGRLEARFGDFVPLSPTRPRTFGFMWNDFSIFATEQSLAYIKDRGWVYGLAGTTALLAAQSSAEARVRAVFRAHQHSKTLTPMMQRLIASGGVFRHWQSADASGLATAPPQLLKRLLETSSERAVESGGVYTFNVSPDSVYGLQCQYGFATYGILTLAETFADWKLEVVTLPVAVD